MNGFLEIVIKGIKYGVKFGMYALKLVSEKRSISIDELDKLIMGGEETDRLKQYDLFVDLLHAGICNAKLILGESDETNYYKLYDDCTDLDGAKAVEIWKALYKSYGIDVDVADEQAKVEDQPASKKK